MKLVDNRELPLSTPHFTELKIGDCYQDEAGNICIKIGRERCMYFDADGDWDTANQDPNEPIIPLKATITIER